MRIAYPDNQLAAPLVENINDVCAELGWTPVACNEVRAAEMLLNGMADAALVSPLGYGKAVAKVDYRIIKDPIVQLEDFTAVAGVNFAPKISDIRSYGSKTPDEFLITVGGLILAEKFETALEQTPADRADFIIDYTPPGVTMALDVGEEWFDAMELPLPTYIWACRIDADIDNLPQAVQRMANAQLLEKHISEMIPPGSDHYPREGKISYRWTSETEEAMESVLHILFYHQHLAEIPAVKLLGRD